jgi:hypothetical protein
MITPTPRRRRVRGTSLDAWTVIKPGLAPRQQMVAAKLRAKKGSIRDIALRMRVDKSQISGRFSELEKLGIIKDVGRKHYKDSTLAHTVYELVKELSK